MNAVMLEEIGFTDARADLSSVFDRVIHQIQPVIIRRRQDKAVIMKNDMLALLLQHLQLKGEMVVDSDKSYTVTLDAPFDLYGNGPTPEEAINDLVQDLKLYAEQYMSLLPVFLHAPNRREHLPYILKITLFANEDAQIKEMLCIRHAEV